MSNPEPKGGENDKKVCLILRSSVFCVDRLMCSIKFVCLIKPLLLLLDLSDKDGSISAGDG